MLPINNLNDINVPVDADIILFGGLYSNELNIGNNVLITSKVDTVVHHQPTNVSHPCH